MSGVTPVTGNKHTITHLYLSYMISILFGTETTNLTAEFLYVRYGNTTHGGPLEHVKQYK